MLVVQTSLNQESLSVAIANRWSSALQWKKAVTTFTISLLNFCLCLQHDFIVTAILFLTNKAQLNIRKVLNNQIDVMFNIFTLQPRDFKMEVTAYRIPLQSRVGGDFLSFQGNEEALSWILQFSLAQRQLFIYTS